MKIIEPAACLITTSLVQESHGVVVVPEQRAERSAETFSRGRAHAAFCRNSWASRQVDIAKKVSDLSGFTILCFDV